MIQFIFLLAIILIAIYFMSLILIEVFNQRLINNRQSSIIVHLHPFTKNGIKKNTFIVQKDKSNDLNNPIIEGFSKQTNKLPNICTKNCSKKCKTCSGSGLFNNKKKIKQVIKKPRLLTNKKPHQTFLKKTKKSKSSPLKESFTNYVSVGGQIDMLNSTYTNNVSCNDKYLKKISNRYSSVVKDLLCR